MKNRANTHEHWLEEAISEFNRFTAWSKTSKPLIVESRSEKFQEKKKKVLFPKVPLHSVRPVVTVIYFWGHEKSLEKPTLFYYITVG